MSNATKDEAFSSPPPSDTAAAANGTVYRTRKLVPTLARSVEDFLNRSCAPAMCPIGGNP